MKKAQFRNLLHVLGGIIIAYILFQTYNGIQLIFQLVLTTLWTGVIGYTWEIGWHLYNKSLVDHKDVVRAVISALVVNVVLFFIK